VNALPKGSFVQLGAKTEEKMGEVTMSRDDTTVEAVERKRYISKTSSLLFSMDERNGRKEQRRNVMKENLKKGWEQSQGQDTAPSTQQETFADDDSNVTSDNRTNEESEGPWRPPDINIAHDDVQPGHELARSVTRTTTTSRTTVTTTIRVQSSPRKGSGTRMV
jgi:hypothetical protein